MLAMNVLIVDDQASQRTMLRHLIEDIGAGISVTDFADPVHALLWSQIEPPDLIVLDYRMPKIDGLEFARRFRRRQSQQDVPVMLVTVVGDESLRQAALDVGVIDFMVKPIKPNELRSRCKNLLELRQRQQALKSRTDLLEGELQTGKNEVEQRELELLTRLAKLASQREGNDWQDTVRMSRLSALLAEGMGLDEERAQAIGHAALLHDIGNIAISDAILKKHGQFTQVDRILMQQHTVFGYQVLSDSRCDLIAAAAEIAQNHHEHWDGTGYPRGVCGEEIPLSARIVAVADVLVALAATRSYRETWAIEDALRHVYQQSGQQFDPNVVMALRSREDEIVSIFKAAEFS